MKTFNERFENILKEKRVGRIVSTITSVLMCVTVFITITLLMNPAVTMDEDKAAICGLESHKHTDECYEDGILFCKIPEHEHDMACFSPYLGIVKYSCGFDYEHTHTEECYTNGVLTCSLTEHTHNGDCHIIESSIQIKMRTLLLGAGADLSAFPVSGTASGCSWSIDAAGALTITGSGSSPSIPTTRPWDTYKANITSVTINQSHVQVNKGNQNKPVWVDYYYDVECSPASNLFSGYTNCTSFNLEHLDISGSTSCYNMFNNCSSMTELIMPTDCNTANCNNLQYMFNNCTSIEEIDLSWMNTSNVTACDRVFYGCTNLKSVDISTLNTSKVTTMSYMFYNCSSLETVDMPQVTYTHNASPLTMSNMFYGCSSLQSIDMSHIDTSTATSFSNMFQNCKALTEIDLSGAFCAPKVTSMQSMFSACSSLEEIDISNLNAPACKSTTYMFSGCTNLRNIDMENGSKSFAVPNCTDFSKMFNSCNSLEAVDTSKLDTSKATNLAGMFMYCYDLTEIDVSGFNTSNCTDMSNMFNSCSSLESIDISNFDMSKCVTVNQMFQMCENLQSIDLEGLDFSSCTTMRSMFTFCESIESFDLSSWTNTDKVTNFSTMFQYCTSMTEADLTGLVTSAATDLSAMFNGDDSLTVDNLNITGWDTSNVTDMSRMFSYADNIDSIEFIDDLDTSSVQKFDSMFTGTSIKEADISGWDTHSAKTMNGMFSSCDYLEKLNISGIDISKCTDFSQFAAFCDFLGEIEADDLEFAENTKINQMFYGASALETLDLSTWDTSGVIDMNGALVGFGAFAENGPEIILGPDFVMPDAEKTSPFRFFNYIGNMSSEEMYMKESSDGTLDSSVKGPDGIAVYQDTSTQSTPYVKFYSIKYDANDGEFSDGTQVKEFYYRVGEEWDFDACPEPVLSGYEMAGWDTVEDSPSTRINETSWRISNRFGRYAGTYDTPAITFYAEWADHSCTLDTALTPIAVVVETGDNNGSVLPSRDFEFQLTCVEAFGPASAVGTATSTGEGTFVIDFGELYFNEPGTYHFEIVPTDSAVNGWVINKSPKIVRVEILEGDNDSLVVGDVISEENGVYVEAPLKFTNVYTYGKNTSNLDEDDKADVKQKNYTVKEEQDTLLKSAEWTDKNKGEAEIELIFNNGYGSQNETRAVYLFCTCLAHDFTIELAEQNINFLRAHYKYVDVISLEDQMNAKGFAQHGASFTEYSTDQDVEDYIETVKFLSGNHAGAMYTIDILTEYFKYFEPTAIYLSFDGTRSFGTDGNPYAFTDSIYLDTFNNDGVNYFEDEIEYNDEQLATISKLARFQREGLYYLMTADKDGEGADGGLYVYSYLEPVDTDTAGYSETAYRNLLKHFFAVVAPAVFEDDPEGVQEIIDLVAEAEDSINWIDMLEDYSQTYRKRVYSYDQPFQALGIDIPLNRQFTLVDVVAGEWEVDEDNIAVGFYTVDGNGEAVFTEYTGTYTVTVEETDSGDTSVSVTFPVMNIFHPVVIRIPVSTDENEYMTVEEWFKATNVGDAYADVNWEYINSKTEEHSTASAVSTKTTTPKLFKDLMFASFDLIKINSSGDFLKDVEFVLYADDVDFAPTGAQTVQYEGKTYYKVGVYSTDEDGKIEFEELPVACNYLLKEVSAPEGYYTTGEFIALSFAAELMLSLDNTPFGVALGSGYNELRVVNITSAELPSTGGQGATIYSAVGFAAMLIAGALLVLKKKLTGYWLW